MLDGYQVRIRDGNALAATEQRLKVLRSVGSAPLPGKSLVVLDPASRLAVDLLPCEDGQAQERRFFGQVLATLKAGQLWLADRTLCTLDFLGGLAQRQAGFVLREPQNLPWQALHELQSVAVIEAGELFEPSNQLETQAGSFRLRRLVLRLAKPTRPGDPEIVVLTNLAPGVASPTQVLQLDRDRWQVEGLFLTVTLNFEGEIATLAYPKAALFSFALALVTYNVLAMLRAALASVHGVEKVEAALSDC